MMCRTNNRVGKEMSLCKAPKKPPLLHEFSSQSCSKCQGSEMYPQWFSHLFYNMAGILWLKTKKNLVMRHPEVCWDVTWFRASDTRLSNLVSIAILTREDVKLSKPTGKVCCKAWSQLRPSCVCMCACTHMLVHAHVCTSCVVGTYYGAPMEVRGQLCQIGSIYILCSRTN